MEKIISNGADTSDTVQKPEIEVVQELKLPLQLNNEISELLNSQGQGISKNNVFNVAIGEIGSPGFNRNGNALIDGQGTETEDWGNFSPPGTIVAIDLGNGTYEHYIVNRYYLWKPYCPTNNQINFLIK